MKLKINKRNVTVPYKDTFIGDVFFYKGELSMQIANGSGLHRLRVGLTTGKYYDSIPDDDTPVEMVQDPTISYG